MNEKRPYQVCIRCVMDTTHPEIEFDTDGVCNYCHAYEEDAQNILLPAAESQVRLAQIVEQMKAVGKNRPYDCILGLSGGVDSSYLAYQLKRLGLRMLAVQFDNGWNSELAVRNIELLCTKLDIDLFTYVVDWEEFRDLQLAFLKASVANIEAPTDHAIFAALYWAAKNFKVKYIAVGNNIVTEQISVPSFGYSYRDVRQIRGIHAKFGKVELKTFPMMGFFKNLYYRKVLGIQQVSILNLIPYNKSDAIRTLEREFGWRYYGGKHHESIITRFHQGYLMLTKFGIDKRRAHLSNLIYSGQISREEALAELKHDACPPDIVKADKEYVAKKLGLTSQELDVLLSLPPKSYRAYPNEEWLYNSYDMLVNIRSKLRIVCQRLFIPQSKDSIAKS